MDDSVLSFMKSASVLTLEAYELQCRSKAANLRKEIRSLLYMLEEEEIRAELCRLVREHRKGLLPD